MRYHWVFLFLFSILPISLFSEPLAKRDYEKNHYFAIEVVKDHLHTDFETKAVEIAKDLNYVLVGRIGELDSHFLFSVDKKDFDGSYRDHKSLMKRHGDHPSIQNSYPLSKKQLMKKGLIENNAPLPDFQQSLKDFQALHINDPLFDMQWHLVGYFLLLSVGISILLILHRCYFVLSKYTSCNLFVPYTHHCLKFNRMELGNDLNILPVWKQNITGENVIVALIDDGIDMDHPDIKDNYYANSSYDFNDHVKEPRPRLYDDFHGTRCAGEIAAIPSNNVCGVGVAYRTKVAAIRMLSAEVDSVSEVEALNYHFHENHIYSCSWGPADDGKTAEGPDNLIEQAFINGVEKGRNGLGSIFVFASGNGGREMDNCNFDGYTNSIYTTTIGAIDRLNLKPSYAELCAAQLVVTYSSGSGSAIATCDNYNKCTFNHGGTSAAAPLAAAAIALALSIRPDLNWRDIQYLLIQAAIPFSLNARDSDWQRTFTGRYFSHKFGYGKLDASTLVEAAKTFKSVGKQAFFSSGEMVHDGPFDIPQGRGNVSVDYTVTEDQLKKESIKLLEHVTVIVTIEHQKRGDIEVFLLSPHGVMSVLATPRPKDESTAGLKNWKFMTVAHWEENPIGTWSVVVIDRNPRFTGKLISCSIHFHGESVMGQNQTMIAKPEIGDHIIPEPVAEAHPSMILNTIIALSAILVLCGVVFVFYRNGYLGYILHRIKNRPRGHVPLTSDGAQMENGRRDSRDKMLSQTFGEDYDETIEISDL